MIGASLGVATARRPTATDLGHEDEPRRNQEAHEAELDDEAPHGVVARAEEEQSGAQRQGLRKRHDAVEIS